MIGARRVNGMGDAIDEGSIKARSERLEAEKNRAHRKCDLNSRTYPGASWPDITVCGVGIIGELIDREDHNVILAPDRLTDRGLAEAYPNALNQLGLAW